MVNTGYNASWNTEAGVHVCMHMQFHHVIECSHVELILFASHSSCLTCKKEQSQLDRVCLCSPVTLSFRMCRSVKQMKQTPPLLCCISDLTAAIQCSCVSLLEYVSCVNLRLSVFSVLLLFFLPICLPLIISFQQQSLGNLFPFSIAIGSQWVLMYDILQFVCVCAPLLSNEMAWSHTHTHTQYLIQGRGEEKNWKW